MATNEEELSVILKLKDEFSLQMKPVLATLDKVQEGFKTLATSAKVASGIIIGSFALTARAIMQQSEELIKLNSITGISVEKLQKLGLAAELNGSSLSELAVGMKNLARQASSAAQGSDEAGAVFKKLGINVLDSAGNLKDTEALFTEVVDKLSKVKNGTEQTALAMQLLGRSGQNLLPVIKQGAAGFDKIGKAAEDLGIIIDKDAIETIESFGDQLTLLKLVGRKLVSEGLLYIAESLPVVIEGFFELAKTITGIVPNVTLGFGRITATAQFMFDVFKGSAKTLPKDMQNFLVAINKVEGAYSANSEAAVRNAEDVEKFKNKTLDAIKMLRDQNDTPPKKNTKEENDREKRLKAIQSENKALQEQAVAWRDARIAYKLTGDDTAYLDAQVKEAEASLKIFIGSAKEDLVIKEEEREQYKLLAQAVETATAARDEHKKAIDEEKKASEDAEKAREKAIEDYEKLFARQLQSVSDLSKQYDFQLTDEQVTSIAEETLKAKTNIEEMFRLAAEARDSDPLAGFAMALKDVSKQFVNMRGYFGGLFRDMEGAFSNAIESMLGGGMKLKNILKNVFNDIKRSFIKMVSDMLAQQMIKQIAGLVMGGLGMGGGPGGAGGIGASAGGGGMSMGSAMGMGGMALSGGLAVSGLGADLGSVGGVSGSSIAMAGAVGGAAIGAEGISSGNVYQSAGGMALSGAAIGTMIMPGIGTAIGAVVGAAYGAYAGNKEKKKQEKAKKEAAAQAAAQQALLEEQKRKAAGLVEKELIGRYAGGLADPGEAAAIGQIFSGGVTPEDLDKMGINPQDVIAREGEINRMTSITVASPNINLNVSSINSAYDIRQVAQDLGYHFTQALQDAAASNP